MSFDSILSRDSFLLMAELRLFWLVAAFYAFSLILHLFHIISRGASGGKAGGALLWTGAFVHVGLIVLRTIETGRAPFQTLYESLSFFACSAVLTYLFVSRRWKGIYLPGTLVAGLAMGASLYALLSRSPAIEPLSPPLQSWWFEWHVVLAFFSYAVFIVSAAVEISYLVMKPLLKSGDGQYGFHKDMLEDFHGTALRLVLFGFPILTFAIFSGASWANVAWGRYWSWDPKETWSLITWTVFTLYLHSKAIPSMKGTPASVFNILGFICMLMTLLGVNWLAKLLGIPSMHVYAV